MLSRDELKDRVFLSVALSIGQLGTCSRGHVGALIVRDGRCVTWGFNGAPAGLPHCDENHHGWLDDEEHRSMLADELDVDDGLTMTELAELAVSKWGCRNATHAEANALAYAARQGISTEGGTCYVECAPCVNCARLLIACGCSRVVYSRVYRDPSGLDLLRTAGLAVDEVH